MMICETQGVGLTATVAGMTVQLNDRQQFRLRGYDLGLANIRRLSQRGPAQIDSETGLGYRIDPRFADLAWSLHGVDLGHYRQLRDLVHGMFQARGELDPIQFVFDFGGGRLRAMDAHLDGALNWASRQHTYEEFSGVFRARDSRLYDPRRRRLEFGIDGTDEGWAIPWEIPWSIGLSVVNQTEALLYAGGSRVAAPEFPVIRIVGPFTEPIIRNRTTDETLAFTAGGGLVVAAGDIVTIDLAGLPRRDARTIRNAAGESVAHFLDVAASDLATWHFAPAGERLPDGSYSDGTNVIEVLGTGATEQTRIIFEWFDRYVAA